MRNKNIVIATILFTMLIVFSYFAYAEPTVTSVTSTTPDGSYKTDQEILFNVTFTEAITVSGVPVILLATTPLRYASHISGSGTENLTFSYIVQSGDNASDLTYESETALVYNGSTIVATSDGDTATLTLPDEATFQGEHAIIIDTTSPTVSSVRSTTTDGNYSAGQAILFNVTFSENVTVSGIPNLTLSTTPTRYALYTGGSGSRNLTFSYIVQSGDSALDLTYASTSALAENGSTIRDTATNNAVLTLPAITNFQDEHAIVIDAVAPYIALNSPVASYNSSDDTITFNFTTTGISSCNISVDNTVEASGISVFNAQNFNVSAIDLTEGVHYWNVSCIDSAGNVNVSAYRLFTIDTTAPTLNINGAQTATKNLPIYAWANFTDSQTGIYRISLLANGTTVNSTTGSFNYTNITLLYVSTIDAINLNITMVATDFAGNNQSSDSMVITVTDTVPTYTLNQPTANQDFQVSTFYLNVTTSADADVCVFNVDYNNSQKSSITNATNYTIDVSNNVCTYLASFGNSTYNYSLTVFINDTTGNWSSAKLNFTVSDATAPVTTFNSTSAVNVSVSDTSAIIKWNASEFVNGSVNYGTTVTLGTFASPDTSFSTKSKSVTITGLTASTKYYFNLTTCDYQGNCITNGTYNFTTSATESDDSDSSSSSSGTSSGTYLPTTTPGQLAKESKSWASVPADTANTFAVVNDKIPVDSVTYTLKAAKNSVTLDVSAVTKPSTLPAVSGQPYSYLKIEGRNMGEIKNAKIAFKVALSWFTQNSADMNKVTLYRYTTEWTKLTTQLIRTDNAFAYYEAATPGFSYFAVSAEKVADTNSPEQPVETAEQPETPQEQQETPDTQPENANLQDETQKAAGNNTWLWIAAALVVIIGAVITYVVVGKKSDVADMPQQGKNKK